MKPSLLGQLLDHRYQVMRTLASGGFGQTYVAADTRRPGQPQCVVKQLKPASNDPLFLENARRLFATEAEILEKLGDHPQIPRLLAYFEEDEEFFLVQELIEGHPLSQELRVGQQWTTGQVYLLLWEVLQLLMFVHDHNVIHRDIKPDNLIRRYSDQQLVLVDFGTVKQVRTQLAIAGQATATIAVGTPGYMPTEQSHGKPRPNSDIYALGIIGIQAATGLSPLYLQEDPETGEIIWCDRAQIHPELAAILVRMVRYHFRERYQTATDVLQALEPLVDQIDLELPESWQNDPYSRSISGRSISGRLISGQPISGRAIPGRSLLNRSISAQAQPNAAPQPTVVALDPSGLAPPQSLHPTVISPEPNLSATPTEVVANPSQSFAETTIALPPISTAQPILEPETLYQELTQAQAILEPEALSSAELMQPPQERREQETQVSEQALSRVNYPIDRAVDAQEASSELKSEPPIETNSPAWQQTIDRLTSLSRSRWLFLGGAAAIIVASIVAGSIYLVQRQAYLQAKQTLDQVQKLQKQKQYDACVQQARTITTRYQDTYRAAQVTLGECLLARATEFAKNRQFKDAIVQALQIAPTMRTYASSQSLIKQWSEQILQIATEQYRQGNLQQAEKIASAIPANTVLATKAQQTLKEWQAEWNQNEALLKSANQAIAQKEWQKALDTTDKIKVLGQSLTPEMPYWKAKVQPIVTKAEQAIAAAAAQKAAERAAQQRAVQSYETPASSGYSSDSGSSGYSSDSSYSAPSYSAPSYSAPSYSAPSYSAPAPPASSQPSGGGSWTREQR